MTIQTWLAYVVTVIFAVTIPGPSVLLSTGHGMRFGLQRTFRTIAGDLSANTLQILIVSVGLGSPLVVASEKVFIIIKWLGTTYLLYLGFQQWRIKRCNSGFFKETHHASSRCLYLQGFLTSAMNPKAILFFLALFPQFINAKESMVKQLSILGITVLVLDGLSLTIYAKLGEQLERWLASKGKTIWLGRISGMLFICAALLLSSFAT